MSGLRLNGIRVSIGHAAASSRSSSARRSFQHCTRLAAGKESELHNEDRAEKAEQHKQDHLKKQKEGKGEWSDTLASDSESIVKADRGEIKDAGASIKQLQEDSARAAQKEKDGEK